ncbi:MAG TPA: PfaD family polyunsaturated fatty acid/polyketide biosynthesis protein, partial [Geobacteraceae bacterium]|nr:PfaD family polyunsaturated fatty acid/polyketide biosynthesis protein [Geobacteraceae bacterium]
PPLLPEQLGDPDFCSFLGIRYPYLGGSMAKGISSVSMLEELGRSGMLGFFGAAGLFPAEVEAAIERLAGSTAKVPCGFNLIHSPHEPELEKEIVSLYLRKGVRLVEASAFLDLTLPLVRYITHGIHRRPDGSVITPNRIVAKVSREELAAKFLSPPPEALLRELVTGGELTAEQAELAASIPVARMITAEADSGGHTDNRPAIALFPTIKSLASRLAEQHGYMQKPFIGLAGGISTPAAAAAAFAMGAAYIMTGSVNQACSESGTSDIVREMLAGTRQADVTMAPAADMFEMGVTVQVLKRGTMFPMRAAKLYEIYRSCAGMDDIPPGEREKLEKNLFHASLDEIWRDTRAYFLRRDPRQAERGDADPKHRMALVFRWYLGLAAHWAKDGEPTRRIDYQVWCGPAMGAFNEWVDGSPLEPLQGRRVVTVALNILFGACVLTRANFLHCQGVELPPAALAVEPLELKQIKEYLR